MENMSKQTMNRTKKTATLFGEEMVFKDLDAMRDELFLHPLPEKPTVEQVLQHALVLFQSEESAFNWLRTHCPALGKTPAAYMDRPKGREHVLRVLFGAYHGVYQ
jgi:hypothetical protein